MDNTKYILELDVKQAKLLAGICEKYARLRMGQWQELIGMCIDYNREDYFDAAAECKEALLNARKFAYPELHGEGHSYGVGKFTDGDMAWEIYEVLRNKIAWTEHPEGGIGVCFDKPMCFSGHSLAKCDVKKSTEE